MARNTRMFLLCCILLLSISCGSDSTGPDDKKPTPTAQEYCRLGWDAFLTKQWYTARTQFNNALTKDATLFDAHLGRATVGLHEGAQYLSVSSYNTFGMYAEELSTAKTLALTPHERSSCAYIYAQLRQHQIALTNDPILLSQLRAMIISELSENISNDAWVFGHGTDYRAYHIHLLLCQEYIADRNFGTEAGSAINELSAWGQLKKVLVLQPGNPLALEYQALLRRL